MRTPVPVFGIRGGPASGQVRSKIMG